jgi:PAS domain S-box-containing protein
MAAKVGARASAKKRREVQPDRLFRAAADQAPLVMWIVNAKGAVTYLNHCWYELVGGMPPKWYGHEWADACHPDDVADMRERWKASSRTGSVFEGIRRVMGQDGAWHTFSYRAMPVIDESGLMCWVGMDTDITDMVRTQAALRIANQELEAFSNAVSHDLRAPLVTVHGFSRLALQRMGPGSDEKVRHWVERMHAAVEHLNQLVDGLLALTRIKGTMRPAKVNLTAMSEGIVERLRHGAPERDTQVTVAPALAAYADERFLAVLMENLLGNAWKFTSRREGARIEVGLHADLPEERVFFVRDNGAGFNMMRADRLFKAFERLHTSEEFPGTARRARMGGVGRRAGRDVLLRAAQAGERRRLQQQGELRSFCQGAARHWRPSMPVW